MERGRAEATGSGLEAPVTRSLDLSLHAWRGIGPDDEPDLFLWRWRLGFVTVTVSRVDVLRAYQELKARAEQLRETAREAVRRLEGREDDGEGR